MKLSEQSYTSIRTVLRRILGEYAEMNGNVHYCTDIYLQPLRETGELIISDEEHKDELARIVVKEWIGYKGKDFYEAIEKILRSELVALKEAGALDELCLLKPYTFVLVDEQMETVVDLLLQDDDTVMLYENLMEGLDEELDAFLKNLMED